MSDPDATVVLCRLVAAAITSAPGADPQALRALAESVVRGPAAARERLGLLLANAISYAVAGDSELRPRAQRPKPVADIFK